MEKQFCVSVLFILCVMTGFSQENQNTRHRARYYGVEPGILQPGELNAITDVKGVRVGQATLIKGDSVRTGVTAIKPHPGTIFQDKVPAAVYVGNGFGKTIGTTQIEELGNLETPILLTNTLNVPKVANSLVDYVLHQEGNEDVRSVNAVVGETNDGYLNAIRRRPVGNKEVKQALKKAKTGKVAEGNVGAGTGTICMGFKGGIGTSSRVLPESKGGYTVGVLVQTNFGGILTIDGAPVGEELDNYYMADAVDYSPDGSGMMIIATDAPLSSRNLKRLAKRSYLAYGKVGSFSSNGSGDYSIAFSTDPDVRIPYDGDAPVKKAPQLRNDEMSPLFLAVLEATEEAIYNSLFMAEDMTGYKDHTKEALPIGKTLSILEKYGVLE